MLSQLDTAIGFVVVMSIVSMLIMIATQACSSVLGLRGLNLADSLEVLFHRLEPRIDPPTCQRLIHLLLTQPVISDTIFSVRPGKGWFINWPIIGCLRRRWIVATAVRPDELIELLQGKASMFALLDHLKAAIPAQPAQDPNVQARILAATTDIGAAQTALDEGADPAAISAALAAAVDAFSQAEAAWRGQPGANLVAPPLSSTLARPALQSFAAAWAALTTNDAKLAELANARAARQLMMAISPVAGVANDAAAKIDRFKKWFNSAQDRAQQWFSMHARICTVIMAVIAAFGLQLDTVQLVHLLATNPDVRAKLVARADALERQSAVVGAQEITPDMHREVIADIKQNAPSSPAASALAALPPIPAGKDFDGAMAWLGSQLSANPAKDAIVAQYAQRLRIISVEQNAKAFSDLLADHSASALQLMPNPYPPMPWTPLIAPHTPSEYWSWPWPHLIGILLSAALLSLGGPFWFSLLSQLASLRTALADAVDSQPEQKLAPAPVVPAA